MANVSLNARVEHAHNASAAEVQRVDVLFHEIEERVVELCEQALIASSCCMNHTSEQIRSEERVRVERVRAIAR